MGRPLDRRRPLWETYVIEGLPDDHFGILTKVHHATIDGASGAELLTLMLDSDPAGDAVEPPGGGVAAGAGAVGLRGAGPRQRRPRAQARAGRWSSPPAWCGTWAEPPATRSLVAAANQMRSGLRGPVGAILNIGRERVARGRDRRTPAQLGSAHAVQRAHHAQPPLRLPVDALDAVKGVKNAIGATVNDVVMAICAGGLRAWLEEHDALPDRPLVAMVPVSIRTGEETEKWTNRVSSIFATLPTDEPDPVQRVARVHEAMAGAKELFDAVPADALTDFAQFPPPAVFARAMRTATRLTGRFSPPVNLVISNVPGPREPLYAAGAKLLHYYPVSTIVDGQGLNITVQSYLDSLDFGLVACRELVPDLQVMLDAIVDDLAALGKATGVDVSL